MRCGPYQGRDGGRERPVLTLMEAKDRDVASSTEINNVQWSDET